jgi:hypothetical protein
MIKIEAFPAHFPKRKNMHLSFEGNLHTGHFDPQIGESRVFKNVSIGHSAVLESTRPSLFKILKNKCIACGAV